MLLIFKLGRPDVLPADDFGVRNGFRKIRGEAELPKPKELLEYGQRWRPHATTAAWYLWRAADAGKIGV
jgi:DNA-3-methyladenine glycosylase II